MQCLWHTGEREGKASHASCPDMSYLKKKRRGLFLYVLVQFVYVLLEGEIKPTGQVLPASL